MMNKSAIKSRITVLLVSSSVLTLFGLVENFTDWLSKPIKCYEINAETNLLQESTTSDDFCIQHVYLPYQKKQGSVKLGVKSKLKNRNYLYTTTTFWIADKLGDEKFSDVEGDFTTDVMRRYNSIGFMTYNKLDLALPNETSPYSTKAYKAYCDNRPIFLNDLFMDPECLKKQSLVWKEVQKISPTLFNDYSIPFSKLVFRWISSNPYKVIAAIIFIIAVAKFDPLHNPRKKISEDQTISSAQLAKERLKQSHKIIIELAVAIVILGGLGYALNNTTYLIPADLLCLNKRDGDKTTINASKNSIVKNVCINEILAPYNSFRGQIELGLIISYNDGTTIVTESVMFVSEDDSFQDVSGDMKHTKISVFNKYGILEKRNSEWIGEQLANLMPENSSIEIWSLVKDKLTGKNEIMYVSIQRVLGEVIEDSLPFMIAACALLYTYSLYLNLNFEKDSSKI